MFTPLILAASALAVPVPKDAAPAGPAPRLVEFIPDADGKVRTVVTRTDTRKVLVLETTVQRVELNATAVPPPVTVTREKDVKTTFSVRVELADVRDLTVTTADGKPADRAAALKRLAAGESAVVSADGKKVDPKYLKLFRDDALVLASPELVAPAPVNNLSANPALLPLPGLAPPVLAAPAPPFQLVAPVPAVMPAPAPMPAAPLPPAPPVVAPVPPMPPGR